MVPQRLTERLIELLQEARARVTVQWEAGGHELVASEVAAARLWLQQTFLRRA